MKTKRPCLCERCRARHLAAEEIRQRRIDAFVNQEMKIRIELGFKGDIGKTMKLIVNGRAVDRRVLTGDTWYRGRTIEEAEAAATAAIEEERRRRQQESGAA